MIETMLYETIISCYVSYFFLVKVRISHVLLLVSLQFFQSRPNGHTLSYVTFGVELTKSATAKKLKITFWFFGLNF